MNQTDIQKVALLDLIREQVEEAIHFARKLSRLCNNQYENLPHNMDNYDDERYARQCYEHALQVEDLLSRLNGLEIEFIMKDLNHAANCNWRAIAKAIDELRD